VYIIVSQQRNIPPKEVLNMILRSRKIHLRLVEKSDYSTLREWRNSENFLRLFSFRRSLVTPDQFEIEMKKGVEKGRFLQFVIVTNKTEKPIGTLYAYGLDIANGHVFIGTYVADLYRGTG
jgi:RimJ/RimL family protein N-acetyltransferase